MKGALGRPSDRLHGVGRGSGLGRSWLVLPGKLASLARAVTKAPEVGPLISSCSPPNKLAALGEVNLKTAD